MRKMGLAWLVVFTMAIIFTSATAIQACCIYNNTTHPLHVDWPGLFNDWTISPTQHQCTNGTGGKPQIFLLNGLRENAISSYVFVNIDDHGWVVVRKKENNRWVVVSKRKDGSIKETKYLTPND